MLINLPVDVRVASLSATVSNAEEFGEWLEATRGATEVVIEERRPVPLDNHYLIGRELHPLFVTRGDDVVPNPALARRGEREWRPGRDTKGRHGRNGPRPVGRGWVPSRVEVVDLLEAERLLPAIYFIFSGPAATRPWSSAGPATSGSPATPSGPRSSSSWSQGGPIDPADLDALGYDLLAESLGRGVASHHAGMLPLFKEAVEELFAQGLVKVVFATETLSLGINMPARTVAIERLTKWQGERHELLTPGEYTQLTGRAGRRGIDSRGAAVVLHQPYIPFERITGLASTRTYPLTSSFRPSYNMAVNLVANYERGQAERLLASSFAQFLADRTVHGAEQTLARNARFLAGYLESAACDRGDVAGYWELRRRLRARESALADADRRAETQEAAEALRSLTPGTVIWLPGGRRRGLAAVIGPAGGRDGSTGILVLTEDRRVRRVAVRDLGGAPLRVGKVAMPRQLSPKSPRFKSYVARALSELDPPERPRPQRRRRAAADDPELAALREELRAHPVHGCPDRAEHEKWMQRHDQLAKEQRPCPSGCGGAPGRWSGPSTGSWGCSAASGTWTASPSPPRARPCVGCTPRPTWWWWRPCTAGCGVAWSRPSWPPASPAWSTRPAAPTAPRATRRSPHRGGRGRPGRPDQAPGRGPRSRGGRRPVPDPRARPRLRRPRLPLGQRRPPRGRPGHRGHHPRRLRPGDQAAHRPAPPGRPGRRRPRGPDRRPRGGRRLPARGGGLLELAVGVGRRAPWRPPSTTGSDHLMCSSWRGHHRVTHRPLAAASAAQPPGGPVVGVGEQVPCLGAGLIAWVEDRDPALGGVGGWGSSRSRAV